jgi:hypothetical protein
MMQRGSTREEVEQTLNEGWEAEDAKPGTRGRIFIFSYNRSWEAKSFEEKEVSVYYKLVNDSPVLLTVKARYGRGFPRKAGSP